MNRKPVSSLVSLAAVLGLLAAPMPAVAQVQANAPEANNPLGLPESVTLLGESNPNVRTATAVVNGDVITGTDVDQRVALVTAANDQELSAEDMQRLKMQVLRNLIDETLQIQEAAAQEIEVTDAEVEQRYTAVAQQNFGQREGAMSAYLQQIGSSPNSLKRQIRGELAWQRLLRRNVAPFVSVSGEEVNEQLDRLEASALIRRHRDPEDRRQVRACITPQGLRRLAKLDGVLDALHRQQLGHLEEQQLRTLSDVLAAARAR